MRCWTPHWRHGYGSFERSAAGYRRAGCAARGPVPPPDGCGRAHCSREAGAGPAGPAAGAGAGNPRPADGAGIEEGTPVKKGQLLAKVNDRQLQAQLQRLVSQLKLAEDRVFRQDALLKRDAVSKEAYEQVKTDLATLNADIEIVKANIALTELRAPFDGIIGLRQISVGSYASPTTIVAKLTKITPLKVEFSVPERYASQIKKGTNLNFRIEGKLDAFSAKVYAVESTIDPNLHQFTARALYPNTNRALLPCRYTSIQLKKEEIPNAIAIPTEAIVPEMGKDKVFLYKSGKAEPVEVTTGIRTDAEVQIVRGLQVGDTILTSGTLQLRLGLPVTLDNID